MKITKTEVRTTYEISIDFKDWVNAIENYKEKETGRIFYPKAFEDFNIDDTTMGNLRHGYHNINFIGNKDTFGYLAHYFGFDSWSNAGIYFERRKAYCMSVYNCGDTANN